eukprot:2565085-Amphidinium_carterae.1
MAAHTTKYNTLGDALLSTATQTNIYCVEVKNTMHCRTLTTTPFALRGGTEASPTSLHRNPSPSTE